MFGSEGVAMKECARTGVAAVAYIFNVEFCHNMNSSWKW